MKMRKMNVKIDVADRPIWIMYKNGSYVSADTWDFLRQKKKKKEKKKKYNPMMVSCLVPSGYSEVGFFVLASCSPFCFG
jgi:hypothetical protein